MITYENLYRAWDDFIRGKRARADVSIFAVTLADTISELYEALIEHTYRHGPYESYMICDPKKRIIHKASVTDRLVHRLIYNALYPCFNNKFLHDSYSCRDGKGTHKARARFRSYANRVSHNYTKQCFVLKFDIKKCFESVDHSVLKALLCQHINDNTLYALVEIIIDSFEQGLPLGNLTSQLFINVYLHELDWYVKQTLRVTNYCRYADDVVIVHSSQSYLAELYIEIEHFLSLKLHLHTHKMEIQSVYSGIDVLGEVFFEKYTRVRRSTQRRAVRRLLEP